VKKMNAREALIHLNLIPGMGSGRMTRLLDAFESPEEVFTATDTSLREILGRYATEDLIQKILAGPQPEILEQELRLTDREEVRIMTVLDPDYPESLLSLPDPPPVLYVKGVLLEEDAAAVAMVGTRTATPYGLNVAKQLSQELARCGVTVVSGLAEGIDGAAHEGALSAGGRTIAVLGHGLTFLYPPIHRGLAQRITAAGALVSEFPMRMSPMKENFPRRNRLIAGLSLGVVVVEAPMASGALITAREAMEQGREVFAVPGPISSPKSKGTHQLLKDGAKLVEEVNDILEELALNLKGRVEDWKEGSSQAVDLSQEASAVYQAIPLGGLMQIDTLAGATAMCPSKLLSILTELELKGLIRQMPGQGYGRSS